MGRNSGVAAFLRSRRAGLQPSDVGLGDTTRRRTPGLRREEVAMLAGVSVDYYIRLEQGRDLQPSDQVLDSVARALRMNETERDRLVRLVRGASRIAPASPPKLAPLRASTRLLLDSLETPALVLDMRGDVHGINSLGAALLVGLIAPQRMDASHTRWLFLDAAARDLLVDWAIVARFTVHRLREAAGRYPQDPELQTLIGELSIASGEFRTWWAEHNVAARCHGLKRFHHPVVGDLELHIEALQLPDDDRWLSVYVPEPGSRSAQGLDLLRSWSAEPDAVRTSQRPSHVGSAEPFSPAVGEMSMTTAAAGDPRRKAGDRSMPAAS